MPEIKRERADLAGHAAGHARRAGDDRGRAGVSLRSGVDVKGARTDLGQATGTGQNRGDLAAESGVLAAVADPEGDGIAEVVDQRDIDGGGLLGTGVETADRERAGDDAGVEPEARGVHHVREGERAVGERVGMLQQDRAVDDGRAAREGVGAGQREHAGAHLGESAGEPFARAAGGGAIADRAGEFHVIAVGVEQDGAHEGDASGDGARAGRDVGRGAARPADSAALGDQAARTVTVTGGEARREHLEGATRIEDEAAPEGVGAGEGDGVPDDIDARLIPAGDVRGEIKHAAAAAESVDPGQARSEDPGVGDVAHARAETHAREVERGLAEIDGRRSGGRRDGHDARAAGVGEAVELRERVGGVRDDGAGLGHREEAAGFVTLEGGDVQGAARGDGDGSVVDGDGRLEGVDAAEGERAQAGLDDPAGGVGGVERADGDGGARAAAAREGDGRDGTRLVGARARDDDARDLAVVDDRVARGGRATRHQSGGTEHDGRRPDVAGAARDGKIALRQTRARGGGEAGEGDGEAVRIDGQRAVRGDGAGDGRVIDRAEQGVRPQPVGRPHTVVRGQDRAGRVPEERRQDALGDRGIGAQRATREIVIAEVAPAIGHGDGGVVADGGDAADDVEESVRRRDGAVAIAELTATEVEVAARDVQRAVRTGAAEDDADLARGILAVDETALPDRELGKALVSQDEPIRPGVGVIEHPRAADITDAHGRGVVLIQVETRRAAAGRHLEQTAGKVEVTVTDAGDPHVPAVGSGEETDRACGLVIDRHGTDDVGALHREEVDVPGDIDDALVRGGAETQVGTRDGAGVTAGQVQRTAVDPGIA